jgi:hypothetical protein
VFEDGIYDGAVEKIIQGDGLLKVVLDVGQRSKPPSTEMIHRSV